MKTAKAPAAPPAEASSNRRSQPVRQARTNPQRSKFLSRDALGGLPPDQPIDIFPGVTHFADAITALPKELVKHFTLLKEVDAKVHVPEEGLFQLIENALNAPDWDQAPPSLDGAGTTAPASAAMSTQNSSVGVVVNGHPPPAESIDGSINNAAFNPTNLPRRQHFRKVAIEIKEMLVSLEEKNHVILTANDALHKQLARIDDVWPHLLNEFSDEAKYGSTTHWAYPENRMARINGNHAQMERSRREAAASLSAAAAQIAEEAAQRSEQRRQAITAKKSSKNKEVQETDFDDADGKQKAEPGKKSGTGKSRKAPAEPTGPVGLGITSGTPVNGNAPAPKRRKVEKPPAAVPPADRAMATVFGTNVLKPKTTSPRESPLPEGQVKKRKALPSSAGQSKKSRTTPAGGPSGTSSPVVGTIPEPPKPARASPAPSQAPPRPVSSRARQNSTHSTPVDSVKPRPPSAASNKPNGVPLVLPELAPQSHNSRSMMDSKPKEVIMPPRHEPVKKEIEPPAPITVAPVTTTTTTTITTTVPTGGHSRKNSTIKADDAQARRELSVSAIPIPQTVTTKSGRASKPSTPALATFAEAARPRPSRASESAGSGGAVATVKRSHKKGASAAAAAAAAQALAAQRADDETGTAGAAPGPGSGAASASGSSATVNSGHGGMKPSNAVNNGKATDNDDDDPLYCYCKQVSYGEMIACDADDCAKEWFHLECVGLKVAPKGNVKWYCEDCKKRLKVNDRKTNGGR